MLSCLATWKNNSYWENVHFSFLSLAVFGKYIILLLGNGCHVNQGGLFCACMSGFVCMLSVCLSLSTSLCCSALGLMWTPCIHFWNCAWCKKTRIFLFDWQRWKRWHKDSEVTLLPHSSCGYCAAFLWFPSTSKKTILCRWIVYSKLPYLECMC